MSGELTLGPYPSGCGPQSSLNPKERLLGLAGSVATAAAAELAAALASYLTASSTAAIGGPTAEGVGAD